MTSAKRAKVSSLRQRNQHFRAGNQLFALEGWLVHAFVRQCHGRQLEFWFVPWEFFTRC